MESFPVILMLLTSIAAGAAWDAVVGVAFAAPAAVGVAAVVVAAAVAALVGAAAWVGVGAGCVGAGAVVGVACCPAQAWSRGSTPRPAIRMPARSMPRRVTFGDCGCDTLLTPRTSQSSLAGPDGHPLTREEDGGFSPPANGDRPGHRWPPYPSTTVFPLPEVRPLYRGADRGVNYLEFRSRHAYNPHPGAGRPCYHRSCGMREEQR